MSPQAHWGPQPQRAAAGEAQPQVQDGPLQAVQAQAAALAAWVVDLVFMVRLLQNVDGDCTMKLPIMGRSSTF